MKKREHEFLSTSEAGRVFMPPLSAEMVRYLERTGQLKAHKTSRGVRFFERTDVERLAARRAARKKKREAD